MSEKMYSIINIELIKKDMKQVLPVGIFLLAIFTMMYATFETTCIFVFMTGFPCPACGLTRAAWCLVTFQWREAIFYNWTIFPIAIYIGGLLIYRYIIGKKMKGKIAIGILIIVGMVITYIYRMVLYYPDIEPVVYHSHNAYNAIRDYIIK